MWTFETDPPFDPVDMTVVQTKNEKSLATESDGLRVTEPSVIKYIKQVKNKQVSPIIQFRDNEVGLDFVCRDQKV